MISKKFDIEIHLTPDEIAAEFCDLCSDEQVLFLNKVAELVEEWKAPFCFQLQGITDDKNLTDDARHIMSQIGEYSEKQNEDLKMGHVTESIFNGKSIIIPMADVQHIEKQWHKEDMASGQKKFDLIGSMVITKHTRWDKDNDAWANSIWLSAEETKDFLIAWSRYRSELEKDTLDVNHK